MIKPLKYIIVFILPILGIISCSKDNSEDSPKVEKKIIQVQKFKKSFAGKGVVKAKYNNGRYLVILEKLSALERIPGERFIELLNIAGENIYSYSNTLSAIIDADLDTEYTYIASITSTEDSKSNISESIIIEKIDSIGKQLSSNIILKEPNSLKVYGDRVKIVVGKQYVYVAVFKNDETTYLYALNKQNLSEEWSLQVEPSVNRPAWGMIGGSYDAFSQLALQYSVYLDTDTAGYAYVGIQVNGGFESSATLNFHNKYFGENLTLKSSNFGSVLIATDALVTKVNPEGHRVYSSVMGTAYHDEIHGMQVVQDKIITYGRCHITPEDWNPYFTVYDTNTGNELFVKDYNLGNNEIFMGAGYNTLTKNFYLGGVTGWSQNPSGVSVSEQGNKILLTANNQNGSIVENIPLQNGPRQNQIRSIQIIGENMFLVAGWENGPGTHSGDSDPNLVYADGFLEVQ